MNRKFFSLPLNHLQFEKDSGDSIRVKMYAISDGINRNECEFMLESFEPAIPSMYNRPILAYFNEKIQDTESHNTKLKLDIATGEYYYDYNYPEAEKPVGTIPESANIFIENFEGKNWIVIDSGIIWTSYNRSLSRLIKRQLKKKVSVEIEVLDSFMDGDIEKITSFKFLGITILGKTSDGRQEVTEGIENAHMKMINFAESESFKKYSHCFEYAEQHKFIKEIEEPDEIRIPILADIKEYMNEFMQGMEDFPSRPSEFLDISSEATVLLANEDLSLDGAKILIDKLEKLMDEGKDVIANIIGGYKMLNYLKQFDDREVFIEKDLIGAGDKIKISLTKKSASNEAWSNVDKTKLRNDILKASNYKDLVNKCYLVVEDGWEDSPSEKLKYPVCQIKNDTLVYNINGVQASRSRLEQNTNETYYKTATTKLNKIYSKLGLDEDKKHMQFKEVARHMKDLFVSLFAEKNEFKYLGNTEKNVLAFSLKDNKFVIIPFEKGEDEHIEMKEEMAKDADVFAKPLKMEDDEEGEEKEDDDKEEFGCGKSMAEEFGELNKEMAEKEEMAKSKEIEMAEKEKAFEEEKAGMAKSAEEEKSKFEDEKKELEAEKEEMAKEVSEFKEEKFAKIIENYSAKISMTDEEKTDWTEKTKTFSDFKAFEMELVFEFKDRMNVEPKHLETKLEFNKKSTTTKKSAIERLKDKL